MTDMNQAEFTDSQESVHFKNSGNDFADRVRTIQDLLSENGADVPSEEIESKLKELTDVFKVPAAEAQRSVTNALLKKYKISKTKAFTGKASAVTKKAADISAMVNAPDTWVNLTAKVIQIWDNNHESIAQAGLAADETGVVKFTLWKGTDIEPLELNKTYEFKNVVVKSWNGKTGISLNKAAVVMPAASEMALRSNDSGIFEPRDKNNEIRTVSALQQDGLWTDLKARIVQIFEKTHESIAFAGILGDETGTLRFTVWKTSEIKNLEAGKTYLFKNAVVKEWNGTFALEINRAGKIEELEETIIAKPAVFEVCGCAVDVQAGSGLIRRCPECNKVMSKGMCSEHGKVKGKYDLRIKAVFDDGKEAHETIINCALTQNLLNIPLEEAVRMATETLDPDCINDIIKKEFVGKYYVVRGAKTDRYIIAESVERAGAPDIENIENLIARLLQERNKMKSPDFEEFEKMLESVENDMEEIADTKDAEVI